MLLNMPALVINEEIEQPLESDPTKELLIKNIIKLWENLEDIV